MALIGKWFGFGRDEILDEGVLLFQRGDVEGAIEALERLLDSSPEKDVERRARAVLGRAYVRLAQIQMKSGDPKGALRSYDSALEYVPAYPDLMLQEARAYGEIGDVQAEKQCVASALEHNPNFAVAHAYGAWLAYRAGRDDVAMSELDRAAELDAQFADARLMAFWQAHRAGERAQAASQLAALTVGSRSDADLLSKLAESQMQDGDWLEACQTLERALKHAPGYADLWERYGETLLQLDRDSEAEHAFRHSIEANPRYADAWAGLGVSLKKQGRTGEARAAFEKAWEIDPDHEVAAFELRKKAS